MLVKKIGRLKNNRSSSFVRSLFGANNPSRSSIFYNRVHEVCRISQDISLFFSGILLGTGHFMTGITMLALKSIMGLIDDEVSYRRSYALTKEAMSSVKNHRKSSKSKKVRSNNFRTQRNH